MALSTIPTAGLSSDQGVNFRNLIINGDMSIAQRGTSSTGITGDGYFTVDRFKNEMLSAGTWTQSQSTDVPSGQGFANSVKYDCTTANASLSAGSYGFITQRFEGQNLQMLKFGTSSAETLTLSFWVKSNKTGTYIAEIITFATTKSQSQSYTISSADTWEKKTLTFTGDTATAIANSNARSLNLVFWLVAGTNNTSGTLNTSFNTTVQANRAVGQVNLADSTDNEWYITGVQLEVGTSASDFEFLPFDVNLRRCERYFYQAGTNINGASEQQLAIGQWYNSSEVVYNMYAPTTMRTKPTLTTPTVTNGYRFHRAGSYQDVDTAGVISTAGNQILTIFKNGLSSGTGGQATFIVTKSSPAKVQWDAEL
jgi:hypothetical protein